MNFGSDLIQTIYGIHCYIFYRTTNLQEFRKICKNDNLYAVCDCRGIAPKGWHVADHNEEWRKLTMYSNVKLKSTFGWDNNGNGTNETGFNALPSGHRYTDGRFAGIGTNASWWSIVGTDEKICSWNPHWFIYNTRNDLDWFGVDAPGGYSVRCIKNLKHI